MNANIDLMITSAADSKLDDDYAVLFDTLKGVELFINVDRGNASKGGEGASTPFAVVAGSRKVIVLFTTKDNPDLKPSFGGIVWERALEMLLKMSGMDGLIVQNKQGTWVGVDKKKALELLGK